MAVHNIKNVKMFCEQSRKAFLYKTPSGLRQTGHIREFLIKSDEKVEDFRLKIFQVKRLSVYICFVFKPHKLLYHISFSVPYTDFAVGAPYEGKGAVYIYHGSREGANEIFSQVGLTLEIKEKESSLTLVIKKRNLVLH